MTLTQRDLSDEKAKDVAVTFVSTTPPEKAPAPANAVTIRRSPWAFVTLSWVDGLLRAGYRKPLQESDLPDLPGKEKAASCASVLDEYWAKLEAYHKDPINHRKPSFVAPLARKFWLLFLISLVLQAVTVAIAILLPTQIENVIEALRTGSGRFITGGFVYAAIYAGMQILQSVSLYTYHSIDVVITIKLRAIFVGGIYRKALRLSPKSRAIYTPGNINSLVNVDVPAFQEFFVCLVNLMGAFAQVGLALYFISQRLGITTYITSGLYLGLAMLVGAVMPFFSSGQQSYMMHLDRRTKSLREFLYGIQTVKYKGLEDHYLKGIAQHRRMQLVGIRRISLAMALMMGKSFKPTVSIIWFR